MSGRRRCGLQCQSLDEGESKSYEGSDVRLRLSIRQSCEKPATLSWRFVFCGKLSYAA